MILIAEGVCPLGEVERNAQPLTLAGSRQHLVSEPAFPQKQKAGTGFDTDEGIRPRGRRHHQRQARIFKPDRARALRNLDVKGAGDDAVRVDVRAVVT